MVQGAEKYSTRGDSCDRSPGRSHRVGHVTFWHGHVSVARTGSPARAWLALHFSDRRDALPSLGPWHRDSQRPENLTPESDSEPSDTRKNGLTQ
jgi:hypothetical protein